MNGYKNQSESVVRTYYNKMKNEYLLNNANIMQYYEFYQFKRGKFNCTGITYDDNATGRVSSISFKFTGNLE